MSVFCIAVRNPAVFKGAFLDQVVTFFDNVENFGLGRAIPDLEMSAFRAFEQELVVAEDGG